MFPFLAAGRAGQQPNTTDQLHDMYLSLLKWKFKGQKKPARQILLFNQLRNLSKMGQHTDDGVLDGICLGNLLPSELMFQYSNPANAKDGKLGSFNTTLRFAPKNNYMTHRFG